MAAAATDVVSLAALKRELRLDPDDTTEDTALTAQIEEAVSYVAAYVRAPLVDMEVVEWVRRPHYPEQPLVLNWRHVKAARIDEIGRRDIDHTLVFERPDRAGGVLQGGDRCHDQRPTGRHGASRRKIASCASASTWPS